MVTNTRTLADMTAPPASSRRPWRAIIGWGALMLLVLTLAALMVWEPLAAKRGSPPPERAYRAEILRDAFGVPHISGRTDADVAYGLARAHAEDDFTTLQDVAAMTRGRYGAIAGEDGAAFDYALALLDARGTAEREYAGLAPDTRTMLEAYATGLNDYAAAHPDEVKLANLFPLDGVDIATGFALRQPFFFGLGNTIGPLVEGEAPPREFGPRITLPGAREQDDGSELNGSNAFAIAPSRSGDDTTRLVSNSHQPWRGGVAWYEAVVESEEGMHFAGATFPGSPFMFLGHNERLGWTNTVNRPDMTDIYRLVVSEDGTQYRLDGEWLPLEKESVRLAARVGPLVVPVWRDVYRSVHGPVIRNEEGYFAIRYGGMGSLAQLDGYYRLPKAQSYEEWRAILASHAIPSTNFIYADETGDIAYIYNASIPERPTGYDWRGVLPGDESAAIWTELVDYDALPQYLNPPSGYLYNANNQPFYATGAADNLAPGDVAPEMGIELTMTNRAWRSHRLLGEANRIDRETLERIKYDTAYDRVGYVAELFDRIDQLDLTDAPELRAARDLLRNWDFNADGVGRADSLALLMIRDTMSARYNKRPDPDTREQLGEAVTHLMEHFGRIDPPQSELLRLRQGDVDLPLDGGSDTLRASTTWDVQEDGRLAVKHGDSFLMFVEWARGEPVRSQSIQPYGQAITRPDSPHFADQAPLFVRHELKPVRFWYRDARAHARRRYVVSHSE